MRASLADDCACHGSRPHPASSPSPARPPACTTWRRLQRAARRSTGAPFTRRHYPAALDADQRTERPRSVRPFCCAPTSGGGRFENRAYAPGAQLAVPEPALVELGALVGQEGALAVRANQVEPGAAERPVAVEAIGAARALHPEYSVHRGSPISISRQGRRNPALPGPRAPTASRLTAECWAGAR